MENEVMNWKEVFKVRPCNTEESEWVITIGNHLATGKKFKTAKAAQQEVEAKSWDLIVSMIFTCIEAKEKEKEVINENSEHLEAN